MAHIYNFAIIQAVPDRLRDERVNIGVLVFRPDGIDVRISETRKLSAISSRAWDADIKSFSEMMRKLDNADTPAEERLRSLNALGASIRLSELGWFEASTELEFDRMVRDVARSMVMKPKRKRHNDAPPLASEITSALREKKLLANKDETIESGLVVPGYEIEHGLKADFVQKNGSFHVAAVLDLRANNPQLAQAALKGVVLDRASEKFANSHRVGIYSAAKERLPELRDNLNILRPYADDIYNWEDMHDREQVTRMFHQAFIAHQRETGARG